MKMRDPCSRMPARLVLAFLTSAGVVVLYILRINLSVAIVAMVDLAPQSSSTNTNNHTSHNNSSSGNGEDFVPYCAAISLGQVNESSHGGGGGGGVDEARSPPSSSSGAQGQQQDGGGHQNTEDNHPTHLNHYTTKDITTTTRAPEPDEGDGTIKLVLTGTERGLVLGAFFYGYAITNIPGGRLAEMYGTKIVFGGAILIGGILTLFIPLAARAHYSVIVVLRTLLGLSNGVVYPAMNVMVARWIPPLERSRFMSFTFTSNTLGTIVTMPVCGFLIAWVGWPSVFYFSGGVALLWVLLWALLMHDTPAQHPRISPEERDYILQALDAESKKGKPTRTPWRSIMTSLPLWGINFAQIGSMFGFNLLLTQLPTYLATILGFSITNNGMLSALPFLTQFVGSVLMGFLSDWLISHKYITIRSSRRLFCTVSHVLPAVVLLLVGYSGCNSALAMTLFCLSAGFSGSIWSGHLANHFDLSPNFAGTIMGVSNTLAFVVSICVPVIVGAMTPDQTLGEWRSVFWLTAACYVINWFLYFVLCSTDIQPWNYPLEEEEEEERGTESEKEGLRGEEEEEGTGEGMKKGREIEENECNKLEERSDICLEEKENESNKLEERSEEKEKEKDCGKIEEEITSDVQNRVSE